MFASSRVYALSCQRIRYTWLPVAGQGLCSLASTRNQELETRNPNTLLIGFLQLVKGYVRVHMISEITKSMKVTQWEENSISSILFAMKSMLLEDHARKSKAVQEHVAFGGGNGGGQGDLGLGRQMDALGKAMARIGAEVSSVVQQQQELMREVATTRSQVSVSLIT